MPSQGHMAPPGLWPHLCQRSSPSELEELCGLQGGPWSSPGVLELQQPSTTHLPWILVWSSGPDSPLLLRWAQPQQVGDRSQAAESVLRTPRSRAWATSPGDAPVPFNTGTCVRSLASSCSPHMRGARRHPPSARVLHPPPGVLSIHLPLGMKRGCAKAGEPVPPALPLSKQPVWVPQARQGSGQNGRTGLCPGRGHVAPLRLGRCLKDTLVSRGLFCRLSLSFLKPSRSCRAPSCPRVKELVITLKLLTILTSENRVLC